MLSTERLPEALATLHRAGLAGDVTQLLDALWLALWRQRHAAAAPALQPLRAADSGDSTAAETPVAPAPAPAPPAPPEGSRYAEVSLAAAAPPASLYAAAAADDGEVLRARAVRVAGVPALRDAGALARALRPLGRRRPSRLRFELDEAASAEAFADTGLPLPVLVAQRERCFAATLLVEETPTLPLWRGAAAELEALLARQGGFRRFRRYTLLATPAGPRLRSGSGALHAADVLGDADASLVLLASDGCSAAWGDGRIAALLRSIGRHSSVAVLQWMPERRWPHTRLGAADARAWLPRAAAPNGELRWQRPRWLDPRAPVLPVPLAALTPPSFAALAATFAGKPGATIGAALLWPDADETGDAAAAAQDERPDDADASLDAEERIRRFLGVAGPRLYQVAVQLSAAAPLTLPVIRLVHHVLQPDAPAEDLPLLLLAGLLQRLPADADGEPAFDFAPGVRAALQRSLGRSDAAAVRQAVWHYIAARSGTPLDFSALLLDPAGALALPAWARPFAEVTQQLQQLFAPPAAASAALTVVREPEWDAGVSLVCQMQLPAPIRQLAWSDDGRRLAVLHEEGLEVLQLRDGGPGRHVWQAEPLPLRHPVRVLFIKGFDLPERVAERLIRRVRDDWQQLFRGELDPVYHTVAAEHRGRSTRALQQDVQRLAALVDRPGAITIAIGGAEFAASAWAATAESRWQELPTQRHRRALFVVDAEGSDGGGARRWRIRNRPGDKPPLTVDGPIEAAASLLLQQIRDAGPRLVTAAAFGAGITSVAWDRDGRLMVADARRGSLIDEASLQRMADFSASIGKGELALVIRDPRSPRFAIAGRDRVLLHDGERRITAVPWPDAMPIEAIDWSADGTRWALRGVQGRAGIVRIDGPGGKAGLESTFDEAVHAGPLWAHRGDRLAWCGFDGRLWIGAADGATPAPAELPLAQALAWSADDHWIACAQLGGRITVLPADGTAGGWSAVDPQPTSDATIRLAFLPQRLDGEHAGLVLARGTRLVLLRLVPGAAPAQAAAAPDDAVADDAAAADSAAEAQAAAQAAALVDAARQVLEAMAIAFHVGRLLPGEGFASRVYAEALGISADSREGRTLQHVVRVSEWLFGSALAAALADGSDPLARPDPDAGRRGWARAIGVLLESPDSALASNIPAAAAAETLAAMQAARTRSVAFAGGVVRRLDAAAQRQIAERLGDDALQRLATLERLDAEPRPADAALLHDSVQALVAAEAARAGWLGGDGDTAFGDCIRLDDYVDRFVHEWAGFARRLLLRRAASRRPDAALIEIGIATPLAALQQVQRWCDTLGPALYIDATPQGERGHGWTVSATGYFELVERLGALLATALAARLGGPPPLAWAVPGTALLWVDDRPQNNHNEALALQRRGFRVVHAFDTDAALQLLADERFDAVISDMGRPPDAQAGITLLRALRERGWRRPFLLYTVAAQKLQVAPQPGPVLITDRFDELEAMLRRLFTRPAGGGGSAA